MSEISDAIQAKCLAFSDRIIKLNDYLLEQAASKRYDGGSQRYDVRKGKSSFRHQTSDLSQPSYVRHQTSRVPVHLQSVAALANQLLRSGTSIGANNAEATNAVSKTDYRAKSYIALKEANETKYWLTLLTKAEYLKEAEYESVMKDLRIIIGTLVNTIKKIKE